MIEQQPQKIRFYIDGIERFIQKKNLHNGLLPRLANLFIELK